jgi:hypothetical protein
MTMAASIPPDQRPTRCSPLDTPAHGSGASYSMSCSITIRAPMAIVLTALLDTTTFASWNAFWPHVTITGQPAPGSAPLPPPLTDSPIAGLPTTLQIGTYFTADVHFKPNSETRDRATALYVTHLEAFQRDDGRRGVRLVWRTDNNLLMPEFVMRTARVQEVVEAAGDAAVGDDVVEYTTWESFHGLLARPIGVAITKSMEWGLSAWMDGLKEYSEEEVKKQKPKQQQQQEQEQ